jgi:hypothetical protein
MISMQIKNYLLKTSNSLFYYLHKGFPFRGSGG